MSVNTSVAMKPGVSGLFDWIESNGSEGPVGIDILVANAGVLGPVTPLAHVDPPQWDNIMAVNVTANWRLVRSLDSLLRASDAGRAVFVSSGILHGEALRPYLGAYAASKAALEAIARTWAAIDAMERRT